MRLPAHPTVHGQVLMGDLSFEELRQPYPQPQFERFTERTPAMRPARCRSSGGFRW
ncbi:DNA-binding IclR family transcriptional regulator [Paraburkholderia atlantica]|uniref:hypothetical protein n=1 Tax=Paraburkholderia atlantica TaxID=2654982 RepID=UPI0003AA48E3